MSGAGGINSAGVWAIAAGTIAIGLSNPRMICKSVIFAIGFFCIDIGEDVDGDGDVAIGGFGDWFCKESN